MSETRKSAESPDRYIVPGLVRGLRVLQAFTPERRELGLSEIAEILSTTRSAAFRTVHTLAQLGYLLHDQRSGRYVLGPAVLRLGYGYLATRELIEVALPELERLREATDWSTHLGVRDGRFVLYMLRVPSHMNLSSIVHVGSRLPAERTTMGRVLLAELSEAAVIALYRDDGGKTASGRLPRGLKDIVAQWKRDRESGVVIQVGSFESGVASVAAPVRDMSGNVIAAINATQTVSESASREAAQRVKRAVVETATTISQLLGAAPPYRP